MTGRHSRTPRHSFRRWSRLVGITVILSAVVGSQARAHSGPPYPIVVDHRVGACIVSLWGDPDVGTGTFIYSVEPAPGQEVPGDLAIQMTVQPLSKRLAPATHTATRVTGRIPIQFTAKVPFDARERWSSIATIRCGEASDSLTAEFDVTPDGLDKVSVMIYIFPFLFLAILWTRALFRKRAIDRGPSSAKA